MLSQEEKRLQKLFELKETVTQFSELDEILDSGLRKMVEITDLDGGCVYLVDKGGTLVLKCSIGLPQKLLKTLSRLVLGEGITGSVASTGKVEIVSDLTKDDRIAKKIVKRYGIRTFVSIPLTGGDETHGVMNIFSFSVRDIDGDEEFYKRAGEFIGNSINNIVIYQRIQHQVERMRVLNDINLELTMILNIISIIKKIPEYITKLFQVRDYAIVFNKKIKLVSKIKGIKDVRTQGFKKVRLGFSRPSLGRLIFEGSRGDVILVNDYFNDSRFPTPVKKDGLLKMSRAILGSPLIFGRNNLGIIVIGSHKAGAFDNEDSHIFKLFSACISAGIGNSLLFSDLRNSYRRLRAAQKVIIKGEKIAALIRLTTQIAHRIKNSLGAIQTSIDVLKKESELSEDSRELIEVIGMENKKLNKLVDDFFEFAGPENSGLEDVNLPDLLDDTINSFLDELEQTVKINREYDRRITSMRIDPKRISSLIRCLLENAVDAIPGDRGEIKIGYRLCGGNGARDKEVEFFVKDNGCGIEPALIPKVMEPFFTTKPGGNGLGLSIVERIAEAHGGSVSIDSVKNQGTCVRVIIPVR